MKQFLTVLSIHFKNRIRDKSTLIWSFMLPILFTIVFAMVMGESTESNSTKIGVLFESAIDESQKSEIISSCENLGLSVIEFISRSNLEESFANESIDFGIEFSAIDKTLNMLSIFPTNKENGKNNQFIAENLAEELSLGTSAENSHVKTVDIDKSESITAMSFTMSGIVAFSIVASSVGSLILSLGFLRKNRILKRIIATPASEKIFVFTDILNTLWISALSTVLVLIICRFVWAVNFEISPLEFIAAFVSSTIFMAAFGGLLLTVFKDPQVANNVSSILVNFLMMFFSGLWIPLELFPAWMKVFSGILPMTYVAKIIRFSLGQIEMGSNEFWYINLLFVALAAVIIPFVGKRSFEMERI